ncbi:hypothetical protein EJ05DRAFT_503656 [Pseudovirgaria hyperparasitica]|uniref:Uncharacterized protein n=1 Tax=Pseudovirgaria hyperparasitica TaxID=470096 RepID=A0A6A6VX03_9PEZI|nr:uncharacterized protein EJ05DRAFT_503656 [Pseudovirgaria hyperparasitica]KAF2754705.1 hypothetical protein EJ05DRAFT_503656 [Pseudovirgaria hyperparasitica]
MSAVACYKAFAVDWLRLAMPQRPPVVPTVDPDSQGILPPIIKSYDIVFEDSLAEMHKSSRSIGMIGDIPECVVGEAAAAATRSIVRTSGATVTIQPWLKINCEILSGQHLHKSIDKNGTALGLQRWERLRLHTTRSHNPEHAHTRMPVAIVLVSSVQQSPLIASPRREYRALRSTRSTAPAIRSTVSRTHRLRLSIALSEFHSGLVAEMRLRMGGVRTAGYRLYSSAVRIQLYIPSATGPVIFLLTSLEHPVGAFANQGPCSKFGAVRCDELLASYLEPSGRKLVEQGKTNDESKT